MIVTSTTYALLAYRWTSLLPCMHETTARTSLCSCLPLVDHSGGSPSTCVGRCWCAPSSRADVPCSAPLPLNHLVGACHCPLGSVNTPCCPRRGSEEPLGTRSTLMPHWFFDSSSFFTVFSAFSAALHISIAFCNVNDVSRNSLFFTL